jgi:capsular exopolysaccharide synthesis family protein
LDKVYQSEAVTKKKIAQNPIQVEYLLSVERQQKIKEALYLFLLQKREENELTYAFTAYNTRIVSPPMGNIIPVFPNKRKLFLIAFLLGIIFPCTVLLTLEGLNTNIKSRKDLTGLSVPLISEIPWAGKRHLLHLPIRRKHKNEVAIIVNSKDQNRVNEAFRIARTNIDFMHENIGNGSVVMVTSFNPDSGKSFITTNLAICMSIRGSRVLIIDLDLRKATTSSIVGSPKTGVSDYLAGKEKEVGKIIFKSETYENLNVLPVGKISPNPSELLASPKLKELISSLKPLYDYILLDCTPIDIVADAALVNKVSDTAIFVIRAGLFARRDLPYIQELYDAKAYNNIRIILNNSDVYEKYGYDKYGKYGKYGYSRLFNSK